MQNLRNIAIIAHVDHGKTTLVDQLLRQGGAFRANEEVDERVMDSNDIEKERGITILSKNTAVMYNDTKINIIDTPGHADFGGEVERVLKMVDGVVLLVDAKEGPMPQTRFVLSKALALNLKPIVVINKIDKDGARCGWVIDKVLELFIELDATDEQLDFPVVYASAKQGFAKMNLNDEEVDMKPLFDTIIKEIPAPNKDEKESLQLLISNIDFNEYTGRIGIGRVERGTIHTGETVALCTRDGSVKSIKVGKLYTYMGLKRVEVAEAEAGEVVCIAGMDGVEIGETLADVNNPEAIPFVDIDEPTVSMTFSVNNGPFVGQDGKFITSRHLRERLYKELERNVSLRVEDTDQADSFKVSGRGELHLSILIENMRREGYELMVSRPEVIFKTIDGVKCEPYELVTIDVPEELMGVVMEKMGTRKGEMTNMSSGGNDGYVRLEFVIPSRGLIGYRNEFMTDTRGTGIMNSIFDSYKPAKDDFSTRKYGVLTAFENGKACAYGIFNAQDRGIMFVEPGDEVYEGMIVGENARGNDIPVNVCKEKHLTNTRASGSDEALKLVPAKHMTLEQAIEYIEADELVEVTPNNIRIRKKILDPQERVKAMRAAGMFDKN